MVDYKIKWEGIWVHERERGKGGPRDPKFSKSPSLHIITMCIIKNTYHQLLNTSGGWWGSWTSIVMRSGLKECKRHHLHVNLNLTQIWTIMLPLHYIDINLNWAFPRDYYIHPSLDPSFIHPWTTIQMAHAMQQIIIHEGAFIQIHKWPDKAYGEKAMNLRREMGDYIGAYRLGW